MQRDPYVDVRLYVEETGPLQSGRIGLRKELTGVYEYFIESYTFY